MANINTPTMLGRELIGWGWTNRAFDLLIDSIKQGDVDGFDLELLEDTACEARVERRFKDSVTEGGQP